MKKKGETNIRRDFIALLFELYFIKKVPRLSAFLRISKKTEMFSENVYMEPFFFNGEFLIEEFDFFLKNLQ